MKTLLAFKPSGVMLIMLINVKMPIYANKCRHFNIYDHAKFQAQLNLA